MSSVSFNATEIIDNIVECIKSLFGESKAEGVVVGLSGGLDSSTTAYLLVKALGKEKIHALIMPDRETNFGDIEDALEVARKLGITYSVIDITETVASVLKAFGSTYETAPKVAKGNVKARARMIMLYYYSNTHNYLVAATSDRSEYLIGYYTKWGDGAGDIYPILSLYKTQVRRIARELGVPSRIIEKPSSPGLWPGQRAEDELGIDYDTLDKVLETIVDLHMDIEEASAKTGIPKEKIKKVWNMIQRTSHKRNPIKSCPLKG